MEFSGRQFIIMQPTVHSRSQQLRLWEPTRTTDEGRQRYWGTEQPLKSGFWKSERNIHKKLVNKSEGSRVRHSLNKALYIRALNTIPPLKTVNAYLLTWKIFFNLLWFILYFITVQWFTPRSYEIRRPPRVAESQTLQTEIARPWRTWMSLEISCFRENKTNNNKKRKERGEKPYRFQNFHKS